MAGQSADVVTKEIKGLLIGQNPEAKNVVRVETHESSSKEGKVADSNGSHSSPPEDDDDEAQGDVPSQDGGSAAKKKKKKSKSKKKKGPLQQTNPPSIPIDELFPS